MQTSPAHHEAADGAPRGRIEAIVAELNRDKGPLARLTHEGTLPFGPSMVIDRFVLGNGLTIFTLEDHAAPVICFETWFGVGSRHEHVGKTGIAHLFEHLMFGETEGRAHGSFDRLLEEAGAETNAATFLDWTYYHMNLPKDALELGVRLEAERMTKFVLREPQVTSEKEVVSNERRQRVDDDVDGAVSEILYKEAFKTHAYSWPTIGWMEDIQSFTPEDCMQFYRTYYAPNNATLVAVGDVDLRAFLGYVQEHYGAFTRSTIPVEDVRPEPPQVEERRSRVSKPTPTQKVAIGYRSPALGDVDHAPFVLLNEILFGGRSSRVHRAMVQEQEIASDVRGWVGAFRDQALYDVFLGARAEHTNVELIAALDALFDAARAEPVTEDELEKAKARLELSVVQGLETVSGKAEQIGFYAVVLGDPGALFEKLAAYRRVTTSDLLRVARRYLVSSARTVIEVFPDGTAGKPEEGEGEGDEDDDNEDDADDGIVSRVAPSGTGGAS